MKLLDRFNFWLLRRRVARHRLWAARYKVLLPPPDPKCARNKTECVP